MSEEILTSLKNGVRIIRFNKPQRKNAINAAMYVAVMKILQADAKNDEIVVTIITGTGDFYSSGNDFGESMKVMTESEDTEHALNSRLGILKQYIDTFITYPKILIAVVNGPAIGIAATTLPLCDVVYATENAWFETPFVKLAICAEGGSSYTFPRFLGRSKASELLLLGERITAREAYECGLVAKVIPQSAVNNFIEKLMQYGQLPVESVKTTKKLILNGISETLLRCNAVELQHLAVRFQSEDFFNAVAKMMSKKKSKL